MHEFLTGRFCAPERSLSFIMFSRGASDIQYQENLKFKLSQITLTWTTACIYSDLQLLAVSFAGITYDWSNWRDEILSSLLNMF